MISEVPLTGDIFPFPSKFQVMELSDAIWNDFLEGVCIKKLFLLTECVKRLPLRTFELR